MAAISKRPSGGMAPAQADLPCLIDDRRRNGSVECADLPTLVRTRHRLRGHAARRGGQSIAARCPRCRSRGGVSAPCRSPLSASGRGQTSREHLVSVLAATMRLAGGFRFPESRPVTGKIPGHSQIRRQHTDAHMARNLARISHRVCYAGFAASASSSWGTGPALLVSPKSSRMA